MVSRSGTTCLSEDPEIRARMRASRAESCGGVIIEGVVTFRATKSEMDAVALDDDNSGTLAL